VTFGYELMMFGRWLLVAESMPLVKVALDSQWIWHWYRSEGEIPVIISFRTNVHPRGRHREEHEPIFSRSLSLGTYHILHLYSWTVV
jgi:hypothetical protein